MGYLKDRHGIFMIGTTPPGTCPECATVHDPQLPHNRDSLAYQYKFYDAHGRFPSWADAMAHCTDEMKAYWTQELEKRGVNVGRIPETEQRDITIAMRKGEAT